MIKINIDFILNKISNADDIKDIKEAYEFANKHLMGLHRKNGDTVINHVLEVTNILIDLNVDKVTIICSILHEVILNGVAVEEISNLFGSEVGAIISCLDKINKLDMPDDSEQSSIYLRKVMVGLSEDVRVLFIKLADRLHNMRTMANFSKEHQKKVANETLTVLVPIAHRLGINAIKSELENLCLYYLKPNVYNDILEKLNDSSSELNEYLNSMKENISRILIDNEIKFEIKGRVKSVYSIYNKLSNGKKWEDIYDILALRVFVEKESECYQVVGLIHSKYRPIPSRFKDYIAVPKENMYQSLHTTVVGEGGKYYEVQIRTYEMDELAEKGIASHWSYKEKGTKRVQNLMEQKLELYRSIIDNVDESSNTDASEAFKSDVLGDLIYVFTPKGDVVELPKDSTPIDFAYRIHTNVGSTMVGAIVNDQMVPITNPLQDQDVVKIITNSSSLPKKEWLNYVKTSQAKNSIKSYFSKIDRENYIEKGKNILEKELRKRKLTFSDILSNDNVEKICKGLKIKDIEDLYLAIGSFRYTAGYVINTMVGSDTEDTFVVKHKTIYGNKTNDILVDGKASILTHIAKCCKPVKGDEIVGYITKNDGIAIHRKNCENVLFDKERIVNVSWVNNSEGLYDTTLYIEISSEKNKLSDLIGVITNENLNIINISTPNDNTYKIDLKVKNIDDINIVIKNMRKLRYVKDVKRI